MQRKLGFACVAWALLVADTLLAQQPKVEPPREGAPRESQPRGGEPRGDLPMPQPPRPLQPNLLPELDAAYKKGIELRHKRPHEALKHLEIAAALAPKVFGPDHLNTAGIMRTLGSCCLDVGDVNRAEALYRAGLRITEAKFGVKHTSYLMGLADLAAVLNRQDKHAEAEELYRRSLEGLEDRGVPDDVDIALTMNNLAGLYSDTGRFLEAETLYRRSLQIREQILGSDHPGIAFNLNNLGHACEVLNRFEEAETLMRRSLRIAETKLGKEHPQYAQSLSNLAGLMQHQGRYAEAEPLLRESLKWREVRLGPDHPDVATGLNNLGNLFLLQGRTPDAEALFRRALRIVESRLGPDDPKTAATLEYLANIHRGLGRFEEAEAIYLRCLKINETKRGPDHPHVADVLHELGNNYEHQLRPREAEACYARALKIKEAKYGRDNVKVAITLNSLAIVHSSLGRLDLAEQLYTRALAILEGKHGKNNSESITMLHNLAVLQLRQRNYEQAEALLKDGLNRTSGKENQEYHQAHFQRTLADLFHVTDRSRQAWDMLDRSMRHDEQRLHQVFGFSSESAMQSYLRTRTAVLPRIVSLAATTETPGEAHAISLTWTLRLKGVMLDCLCQFRQAQHLLTPDDELGKKAVQYRHLKQRLANAALNPPKGGNTEAWQKQLGQWQMEATDLEADLNRNISDKLAALPRDEVSAAAVQKRLPADAALIEWVRSPLRNLKTDSWSPHHYLAYVVTRDSPPRLFDLGEAKPIDEGVEAVRKEFADLQEKLRECENDEEVQALEKTQEKQFHKVAAALHQRLFAPLRPSLGQAKLIYLAADGALNRLPFEALVDEKGKYLVESHRFAYLSTGRDLLRKAASAAKGTVVFAGPDFKTEPEQRQALAGKILKNGKPDIVALRNLPGRELRSVGWKHLPGAAAEARDIHKTLAESAYGPVRSFVGPEALEEVLKGLAPPRILHLATHGFFLDHDPGAATPSEEASGAGAVRSRLKQVDNPLLRSGIVLAGANTIGDKDAKDVAKVEDGWVTAEEIALLNLRGTELVVLSACQTGLGDFRNGDGVYGLRRAFLYAGARTLLTSLFEVPDNETRDLMQRFYGGLQTGNGKLASLHAAQRGLIAQRRQSHAAAHPFFWASFVLVGDPE